MDRKRTEKIKLVFSAEPVGEKEIFMLGAAELSLQSMTASVDNLRALRAILDRIQNLKLNPTFYDSDGHLIRNIRRKRKWNHVLTPELDLQYGLVGAHTFSYLVIEELLPCVAGSWDDWAVQLCGLGEFVQAWVADVEYEYWQNAQNLSLYEYSNRDYSRLPLKSNSSPYPRDAMIVDITGNPSRWSLQRGYIEAIGAVMWLGDKFWDRVGRERKAEVLAADWLSVREVGNGVLRIQSAEKTFESTDTANAQNRLRALLYQ